MEKYNATKLERAKTQLILGHPFFASILLKRPITVTEDFPTAAINKSGHIFVNPEFIEPLSVQQVVFLLAHECMHWIMMTFTRQGNRDPKGWNFATDAVNNEILIASNVGEFIEGGVRWAGAQDMTAEEVYQQLPDEPGGGGGKEVDNGGIGDDLDYSGDPITPEEASTLEAQIKVEVAQAQQAAKQMGSMPGALDRLITDLLHPETPWYVILERFFDARAKDDYSWCRPNRRFVHQGVYLPSMDSDCMGEVAIIVDTSGSVSQAELACFASHINSIMETTTPEQVHVVYVDADVSRVDTHEADELPIEFRPAGGGGTDMRVGVEYIERHLPDVSAIVMLTDGYTPWPDHVEVPMIVACTSDKTCPVAETIRLRVD